jgi:magnesium transporter
VRKFQKIIVGMRMEHLMSNQRTEQSFELADELRWLDVPAAAKAVSEMPATDAALVLSALHISVVRDILLALKPEVRKQIMESVSENVRTQWALDFQYPEDTVGSLMESALAVFSPKTTVGQAIERLRELIKQSLINYGFTVDEDGHLVGVFAFRELLFAQHEQPLSDITVNNPFALRARALLGDAMQEVVTRHFPAYPVCDENNRLLGIVRGHVLFEAQAFEISAQAGLMQGVDKEERLSTSWVRSLKLRHPWLQLNLLTVFAAAAVVGVFQDAIDRIVVLAAFLPVVSGQSGNTGCQALAVTLRGLTLGELKKRSATSLVLKECVLGLSNGFLVGVLAGMAMWFYAHAQHLPDAVLLGGIVWFSMMLACMISGVLGALTPLVLKRLGADPATASSIFLTTFTDVVSMGVFLFLANALIT